MTDSDFAADISQGFEEEGAARLKAWQRQNALHLQDKDICQTMRLSRLISVADQWKELRCQQRAKQIETRKLINRNREAKQGYDSAVEPWKAVAELLPEKLPAYQSAKLIKPGAPIDLRKMHETIMKLKDNPPTHVRTSPVRDMEEDKLKSELLVLQLLKLVCVPKGQLRYCYGDLVHEFRNLEVLSQRTSDLHDTDFARMFHQVFCTQITDSGGKPTHKFWAGIATSRLDTEFEFKEELGSGASGRVSRCESKVDKQPYAIKSIGIRKDKSKKQIEYVLREVFSLSKLSHPNVIRYYSSWMELIQDIETPDDSSSNSNVAALSDDFLEAYEHGDCYSSNTESSLERATALPSSEQTTAVLASSSATSHAFAPASIYGRILFIQMEYCPYRLSDYLDDPIRYKALEVKKVFKEIVLALQHIHSRDIVHRDLAPKNILLDSSLSVKVGDFGFSKSLSSTGSKGDTGTIGTPFYIAPEVLSSSRITTKVDIYALGVIMFELWTFIDNPKSKYQALGGLSRMQFPEQWEQNHPHVAAFVKKLLSQDPGERPSAAEILFMLDSIE